MQLICAGVLQNQNFIHNFDNVKVTKNNPTIYPMPKNKNALARCHVIDSCLSNPYKEFTVWDLMARCERELGINVSRRTILYDLEYIESDDGWGKYGVEIERKRDARNRVYFRYKDINKTIRSSSLSQIEAEQLRETITMLSRFNGLPQFEWIGEIVSRLENSFQLTGSPRGVIGFEQNVDIAGIEHLSTLFGYIINKRCVEVVYRKFSGAELTWQIHPYYIKQYNQRWFLFGRNSKYDNITNIPLDRIIAVKGIDIPYIDTDINFDEYFDDVVGVTIPADGTPEEVVLKFSPYRFPYVHSKPLHWSQKIVDHEQGIVKIKVIPNRELISLIGSFGADVEVIAPTSLREEISRQIQELQKKYEVCK